MRGLGFAIVLIVLMPFNGRAQDYANATNAAWCAGALGAYAQRPSEPGATYLDRAQSRQLLIALREKGWVPYRVWFEDQEDLWVAKVIDWGQAA